MKKMITIFLLYCFTCLLWSEINPPQLALSLEECLNLAAQESLPMLRAESARQKLDFLEIYRLLPYIPRLDYDQTTHYFFDEVLENGAMYDNTSQFEIRSRLGFRQRIFDQNLIELFKKENNDKIKQEIIALSFRSAIFYIVREAYYAALITELKIRALEQFRDMLQAASQPGSDIHSQLLQYQLQDFMINLDLAILENRYTLQTHKRVLLKTMQKTFHSELTLTSPLTEVKIDAEKHAQLALQNNVFLKMNMLEKIRKEKGLSALNFSYFPAIRVDLTGKLNQDLDVKLGAEFSGNPQVPYTVDLMGDLLLTDKLWEYDYDTQSWRVEPEDYSPLERKYFAVNFTLSFSPQDVFNTNLKKKIIRNELYDLELDTKVKVLGILQTLAAQTAYLKHAHEVLPVLDKKIRLRQEILRLAGSGLEITELASLDFLMENCITVQKLINEKYALLTAQYHRQNQYLTELESGTRFEVMP